jgi:hypothetical protein
MLERTKPLTNTWIQTFTGVPYDVYDPDPNDVILEDIAHALAYQCRYNGHSSQFYSVAEHSVHIAQFIVEEIFCTPQKLAGYELGPEIALAALLHDAAEAYVGDVPTPIKQSMPELFKELEEKNLKVICKRFDVPYELTQHPLIKEADKRILVNEREILMQGPLTWKTDHLKPLPDTRLLCLAPVFAKEAFTEFFHLMSLRA